MNKQLIGFVIFGFVSFNLFADEDCLSKYKDSSAKKHLRYNRDLDHYQKNFNNAHSNIIADQFRGSISGNGLISSAYLQNSTPPNLSDYDIFEDEIIKAVSVDLKSPVSSKPKLLEDIYNSAFEKHSDVSYEKIQNLILKGFLTHKFCGFLGKSRENGVERFVLNELKKTSSDSVFERAPAIIDSDIQYEEPQKQNIQPNNHKNSEGHHQ